MSLGFAVDLGRYTEWVVDGYVSDQATFDILTQDFKDARKDTLLSLWEKSPSGILVPYAKPLNCQYVKT